MIVKSTIRKKNERHRWTFAINAALRAPAGMAIVIEGLSHEDMRSAAECIRHRAGADLIAFTRYDLLIAYKPSVAFWERLEGIESGSNRNSH